MSRSTSPTTTSIHTLLRRLLLFTVPAAVISLLYIYNYPAFHNGCAFPSPSSSSSSSPSSAFDNAGGGDGGNAPFRLLVLADPQLEGDTSLPLPEYALARRVAAYWDDIKESAVESVRNITVFVSERAGKHDITAITSPDSNNDTEEEKEDQKKETRQTIQPLHTTILQSTHSLLTRDIPRSLEALRKRIDLLGNDFYLAHIYRTLHSYTSPTHVTVLGDLLGSQWISDEEFERRSWRYWKRVFRGAEMVGERYMSTGDMSRGEAGEVQEKEKVVEKITEKGWSRKLINVAGNHDIGYAGDISPSRIARFEKAFGKVNWDIFFELDASNPSTQEEHSPPAPSIHIINLNDMLLDGPPFSNDLQSETYDYLNSILTRSSPVGDNSTFTILLTHVPLYKPAGICTDAPHFTYFDENDYWGRFYEGGLREQNLLGEHISENGILQALFGMSGDKWMPAGGMGRKGVVLNGHDHTGCDTVHYIQRNTSQDENHDEGSKGWKWVTQRYADAKSKLTDPTEPSIREITLRSMMGEYGGNAGLLSLWFDDAPGRMEWRYEFSVCRFGVQHIWWAVHVIALIAILNVCLYVVSGFAVAAQRESAAEKVAKSGATEKEEKRKEKQQTGADAKASNEKKSENS
ncbi:Metallophosphoesterase domain protein [Ascosphaera apis ARSEF 7405]|uniref:Metallophosphoesterase domain protein n=1 Tax=Ascosphaera apis ARSEF 7405 TaxID=392613 RepID=A0A167WA21_9EURO|nr:Metallophosphoesterase domain protein [Ascosphaera apis ARSEF 7405]